MRNLTRLFAALAALVLTLGATPAMAQQFREVGRFTGPWTTPGKVKVTFPDRIGDFHLDRVAIFGSKDWSASYRLDRDGKRMNTVTVYFYARRRGQTCQEEFTSAEAAIKNANPGMTRVSEGVADSPRGGVTGAALQARYDLSPITASSLYLYCRPASKWWIKARSTWPAEFDQERDVATILRAIIWPEDVAD
jgi:hypothetical protein